MSVTCVRCGAEIELWYFVMLCDACCDERIATYHPNGEAILADLAAPVSVLGADTPRDAK